MQTGTFYTLLACFCWGLIFVVPLYMVEFHTLEVVMARYLLFGLFSLMLLGIELGRTRSFPKMYFWLRAAFMGLVVNLLYYLALVTAMRYSNPAIIVIVASGLCPALVAIVGNKGSKECSPKLLMWPSALILLGVILVNYTTLCEHCVSSTVGEYLFGLGCALFALASWVWYLIANARFLKKEDITPALWSTLMGVTTLFWTLLMAYGHYAMEVNPSFWQKLWYQESGHEIFWISGIVLGVISGWVATFFWNIASKRILISLGGQLLITETLFGVTMVYAYNGIVPPLVELVGMFTLLLSIIWTTHSIYKWKKSTENLAVNPVE